MNDERFIRKVAKLDLTGLEKLRSELVVSTERARARSAKSRGVKDGDAYRKRRMELGYVRTRIALLPRASVPIIET